MADASPDPLLGRELDGRYRLESKLGEGGLGVVYRARHLRLDRDFAIKVLQPEYAQNEALRARFEREAKALGALTHPGVVGVTDFGIDGLSPFLVMELLEGATLDRCMPLPDTRALAILRDVLGAVAFAHGLGLVHRDLKPANVFLQALPEGEERVRVLDFGLAKFLDRSEGTALTKPGATLGTPAYMSPEQNLGGEASPRNDVYSLGILLYELLAHERPFRGVGGDLMRQHLLVPVPSLGDKRPDLSALAALDPIVQRACAKAPLERYADAGEMRAALDHALGRTSGAYAASAVTRSGEQRMLTPPPAASPSPSSDELTTRAPARPAKIDVVAQTLLADSDVTSGSGAALDGGATSRGSAATQRAGSPSAASAEGGAATAKEARTVGPAPSAMSGAATAKEARAVGPLPSAVSAMGGATLEDRPPSPRMPASRPPMKAPVVSPPKKSSGSLGIALVLALVMLVALGAFAMLMPQVFGPAYDPIAWVRGAVAPDASPVGATDPTTPSVASPSTPVVIDAGAAEPIEEPAVADGVDPWSGRIPAELRRHRTRVLAGENLNDSARTSLRVYMRDHPGDPRPQLLMGHADVNRRALTDSTEHYRRAMETNPSARFDPLMLENLVKLSANRTVGDRARTMVTDIYGADALPTLRRVRVDLTDSEEIERLDLLEEALSGS